MDPDNIWQGKLVRLRATEPEDWQQFFDWDHDTEAARLSYFIPVPNSRERAKKKTAEASLAEPQNHQFNWIIETLNGDFAGQINTFNCDQRNGTFWYGIAIKRELRRKGLASEAIGLVLAYYFGELRFQKVNAPVYSLNEPSIKLHQKLGFHEEGRLRRMVYTNGAFFDEIIFGLTVEEFKNT